MYRVVIADDEETIRRGLKTLIESFDLGLRVIATAEDGQEALDAIREFRPEIILMDINMPMMNGLKVIEKARDVDKDAKIIIITGYDRFSYAQKALDLGVYTYLLKPIDYRKFKPLIERAMHDYASRLREKNLLKELTADEMNQTDTGAAVIQYIKENFTNSTLTLNSIAEKHFISESYVSRIVKQRTDLSFTDYLNRLRTHMAIHLLLNTEKNYSIKEISRLVGYNSQHYFSRAFKNYEGMPPKQYRNCNSQTVSEPS
jgi:two-component system response regulator YesN